MKNINRQIEIEHDEIRERSAIQAVLPMPIEQRHSNYVKRSKNRRIRRIRKE